MAFFNDAWHDNPPAPFNPEYKPYAKDISAKTTAIMEARGDYDAGYSREEIAEIRKELYNKLMLEYEMTFLEGL